MTPSSGSVSCVVTQVSDLTVAVTGANGLVGAKTCLLLARRGTQVRAIVRRPGAAPAAAGIQEVVGDPSDRTVMEAALAGADAVVNSVHPLGASEEEQRRIAAEAIPLLARTARDEGVPMLIHISTAAVYQRSPDSGDVTEDSPLVGDEAGIYAVTKRDADEALTHVDGLTRVLVRPPAVLGPGSTSVWNSKRPHVLRTNERARRANPDASFPWIHVTDLSQLVVDVAIGVVAPAGDAADGPVPGGCTPVNVAATTAHQRDYVGAVCDALGVAPAWTTEPAWTGRYDTSRATRWGWRPETRLDQAMTEVRAGLSVGG